MARNLKGLISDVRPQEQPEGTYPFGKNGIQHYIKGSTINEPGFAASPAVIPGKTIGIVETDSKPIFFSTDNVNSFIGFYNPETDLYESILDDTTRDFKLNFNSEWYITGEFQRNYKNQTIVVWTDKHNPLYCLNCDDVALIDTLNDLLFFLQAIPPEITATIDTGGSLLRGAYYVFAKYTRNDGAETAYIVNSAVLTVTNETTGIGDKLINIVVTRLDTRYDKIQFAIISKIDGVMTAVEMEAISLPVDDTATLNATYTGNEITTAATVTDILVQPAVYETVGALGQLNDSLYMGDLTVEPDIKWQKYANLLRINWVNELVNVIDQKTALKNGELKTFMHGEVYAFYARLLLTNGKKTNCFATVGRAPSPADLATSTIGTSVGITAKKFQVENTISGFSPITAGQSYTGQMGIWVNETETYPNDDEYNSSAIGGEDLRGQPVRHSRFPTLDYTHQMFGENHGRTQLDRLGIQVSNIVIPADLQSRIAGIEILYAKRTGDNMTVVGQSTLEFSAYSQRQGVAGTIFATGGNWRTVNRSKGNGVTWGSSETYDSLNLRTDNARFHSFDMLFNRPSVAINYVRPMIKFKYNTPKLRNNIIATGMTPDRGGALAFLLDYTKTNGDVAIPTTPFNNKILKMTNGRYLPNHTLIDRYDNLRQELTYVGDITNFPELLTLPTPGNIYNIGRGKDWGAPTSPGHMADNEETVLCSLNTIKSDLYNAFYLQPLVTTSKVFPIDGNPVTVYGGDCFLCDYTFNTFGHNNDETPPSLGDGFVWAGIRAIRRILCVAASNINARYEITGNAASNWYPNNPVLLNGSKDQYLFRINPGTEPNQFGYSKDLNALNEISGARPWSPDDESVTDYPYRIHRGGKVNRTGKIRSWQTLLPLDFYETQKNMGRIINLCGINDRLLIHHEHALFITQDKAKLESDIIGITLGSGDIFQFEPQEAQYSKLGYAGTQHDLACVLTPMGYVFVDAKQGEVFVWNQQLKPLNAGINDFLKNWATVAEKNNYIGNGITFGYDSQYKRLLFTVKNMNLSNTDEVVRYDYEETPEYFATLTPGVSLVFKDGRIQRFIGANQSPFSCPTFEPPTLPDYAYSVMEGAVSGTVLGTIAATGGTGPYTYYLTIGNSSFVLGATDGVLKVDLPPVYTSPGIITMVAKVVDSKGLSDTGTITVTVIHVPVGPKVPNYEFSVPEQQDPRTVGTIVGTPGDNTTLSYSIVGGNTSGNFSINATTGVLSTTGPLDFFVQNLYTLTIRVTDGASRFADSTVTIQVTAVPRPPEFDSFTFNIYDTHVVGSFIGQGTVATDPDEQPGVEEIVYTLISNDGIGTIDFDLETLIITLNPDTVLDPLVQNSYHIRVRATDGTGMSADAIYTINVTYNPANYVFDPYGYSCAGGECPDGSEESPDGVYCISTLTEPAVPPVGGTPMTATPKTNGVYSTFGSFIYSSGFNVNGTGARAQINPANAWWRNIPSNTTNGPLNRTGLWADNPGDTPYGEWIGFSRYVTIPTSKVYYVGVAGDNKCRIKVNGVTQVEQVPTALAAQTPGGVDVAFKEWHIYPIFLNGGANLIALEGFNDGGPGAFGAEIYDNTPAQLIAATSYAGLTIIFSTKDFRTGVIDTGEGSYTCTDNTYNPIETSPGVYECQKIVRVDRVASTKTITTTKVTNTKYPGRDIVVLQNTPGQVFETRSVPYYAPVGSSPDCVLPVFVNTAKSGSAIRNNCPVGDIGTSVNYNVNSGVYTTQTTVDDANALAQVDVDVTKQYNANINGTCSVSPACADPADFEVDNNGEICAGSQTQLVARYLLGTNLKVGSRAVIEGLDGDGIVVYTGTTLPSGSPTTMLYLCVNTLTLSAVITFRVATILC